MDAFAEYYDISHGKYKTKILPYCCE
jgi:hypothetical protein